MQYFVSYFFLLLFTPISVLRQPNFSTFALYYNYTITLYLYIHKNKDVNGIYLITFCWPSFINYKTSSFRQNCNLLL